MSLSKISWFFILITVFETVLIANSLTGNHVCSRIENYTVTSYETYTEPVVVNSFTWCLQIPPRCPKTWTELRQRYRVKKEEKSRTLEECCEGYKKTALGGAETDASCLPFCEKCVAGACVAPNRCQCDPGYYGDDCARACPSGFWGSQCMQVCNCGESGACDPANGTCQCSPGLQGSRCEERCAIGQWGLGCANECTCQNHVCDAVTGSCTDDDASSVEQTSPVYLRSSTADRLPQTPRISNTEHTEVFSVPRGITERQTEVTIAGINDSWHDMNYIPETTSPATASIAAPPQGTEDSVKETQMKDPSTTARPVIVLVSVPERRRDVEKDRQKFATKDALLRHVQSGESTNVDYVKTVHKDDIQTSTPIPLDIALIVVAAIVSLGLTSLAVVMVLHMRSKLFETIRLAVYDDEKTKGQERESVNGGRTSAVVNSATLPPPAPPIRASPVFAINTEPETILTLDGIESLNTYANGAATIGLRISGNLRDLLQDGHYDRPSATLIRLQTNLDHNTEHLYDEIPFQTTPLSDRKDL
ncbi:Multiple epidermal growth factor-like domains protein 10 [Temnothorax longispinosus]|uniref:Multiple epidermal growth factor-like domains protein 10 n=1 Tax=Temnothorax longispinosus TaxID=300112 RepID=A0A4S2K9I5_9HYME|nr:Multiple epidermal growth factor-like domains protein 10 [Temnothorax longispinosus]